MLYLNCQEYDIFFENKKTKKTLKKVGKSIDRMAI